MKNEDFEKLKSKLQQEGSLSLKVSGTSMLPVMATDETITLTNIDSFNRFDIIVFHDQDILKCHYLWSQNKLVKTSDGQFLLQTRALNPILSYDFPIRQNQILGKINSHKLSAYLKFKIILHYLLNK